MRMGVILVMLWVFLPPAIAAWLLATRHDAAKLIRQNVAPKCSVVILVGHHRRGVGRIPLDGRLGLQQTAALFIGIPAMLATAAVFIPARSAKGVACKAVTIGLLISLVFLGEGVLCVVMSAPLFYLVALLVGAAIGASVVRGRNTRAPLPLLTLMSLMPMSLEGVLPIATFTRETVVSETRVVQAPAAAVGAAILERPRFDRPLPSLLAKGSPVRSPPASMATRFESRCVAARRASTAWNRGPARSCSSALKRGRASSAGARRRTTATCGTSSRGSPRMSNGKPSMRGRPGSRGRCGIAAISIRVVLRPDGALRGPACGRLSHRVGRHAMIDDQYLLVRAAAIYVAALLTAAAVVWRRPDQRTLAGALLAFAWNLPALLAVHLVAIGAGWWRYDVDGGVLLGMPVDLWLAWALLWGPVPAIAMPRVPLPAIALLAVLVDLVAMPAAAPVVQLGPSWLIGEFVSILVCLVPALLLARWTSADRHLVARACLQVLAFTGLLAWLIRSSRSKARTRRWIDPRTQPVWVLSLAVQCLAIPAILGLSAVQEFVTRGRGTPVPFDPPRHIVTTGIYAYVANPMQLSAVLFLFLLAMIVGNVWVASAGLIAHIYSVGLAGWDEKEDLRVALRRGVDRVPAAGAEMDSAMAPVVRRDRDRHAVCLRRMRRVPAGRGLV